MNDILVLIHGLRVGVCGGRREAVKMVLPLWLNVCIVEVNT